MQANTSKHHQTEKNNFVLTNPEISVVFKTLAFGAEMSIDKA